MYGIMYSLVIVELDRFLFAVDLLRCEYVCIVCCVYATGPVCFCCGCVCVCLLVCVCVCKVCVCVFVVCVCVYGVCVHHYFSCSRAGMLMFQPMACLSKPQVNRLHDWFSSFHTEQHTMRRWP